MSINHCTLRLPADIYQAVLIYHSAAVSLLIAAVATIQTRHESQVRGAFKYLNGIW
jgi:hypothetical protein